MSMSTHVVLLRDGTSEDHRKKVKAMEALIEAKVAAPDSLLEYFGISEESEFRADTSGLEVVYASRYSSEPWCERWRTESGDGFEVFLSELPAGVKRIRFYNSY